MSISTVDDFRALVLTGPDTIGGQLLRRYWHPIVYSHELPTGKALPVRLLNEDFTLYRGASGKPYLVGFNCAHRKTQLSAGWVEGECIRCFYHGWMYDGEGQCVDQPAEPEPFADKVRVPSFHAQEYLGMIFAYVGPGEPPPLPRYPDMEFPDRVEPSEESFFRKCNWFQGVENGVDPVHVRFVHIRGENDGRVIRLPIPTFHSVPCGVLIARNGVTSGGIAFPNIHPFTKSIDDEGVDLPPLPTLVWITPVDDETHRQIGIQKLPLPLDHPVIQAYHAKRAARFARYTHQAWEIADAVLDGKMQREETDMTRFHSFTFEDDVAQVGQGRIEDRRGERLGRTDEGVILMRKLWQREVKAFASGQPVGEYPWTPPAIWERSIEDMYQLRPELALAKKLAAVVA